MRNLQRAFDHIDQFARHWISANRIPGLAIAITDRDKVLNVSTYGYADLAAGSPITPETRFEIGSLGKPFTSIAMLQLRDEGKLDLQAPVSRYLPWFKVQSEHPPIAVHHLMNHTAGIVRGTDIAPHGLYEAWALRDSKTSAAPGEYFSYSNIGYKTVGFILEQLSGQSLAEAIQTRVLDPLGMAQTHPVVTHETRKTTAVGYCGHYDDRPEHSSHDLVPAIWAEYSTGDGCEVSTALDMATYLRMLLNRGQGPESRLLSEASFNMMTLDGIWTGGDFYGYGLATYPADDCIYIGHGGGNAGFRSAIVVDLKAGLGVVFLLNRMGETDPVVEAAQHALTVVRAAHLGKDLPPLPPVPDASAIPDAKDYVGTYYDGQHVLKLTAQDGKLLLDHAGTKLALERRAPDTFYVGHPDLELFLLDFRRDGKVVTEAFHGNRWYTRKRLSSTRAFAVPKAWAACTGHYRARNPELSNFRIVLRKGALALIIPWGTTFELIPLEDDGFRIGEDPYSPETIYFDAIIEDRAMRATYSGCPYYRVFTE